MLLVNGLKQGYLVPVILAAFNTAIALYYYLSVVRIAYCTAPDDQNSTVSSTPLTSAASITLLLIIVIMGVMPSRFLDFAGTVINSIM